MNTINPYRRNCEILRNFFAKPVFFALGFIFCISIIAQFFAGSFNFLAILPVIAFFMYYFKGRSNASDASFTAPAVLLKIFAIFQIVCLSVTIACSALMILITSTMSSITSPFELSMYNFAYAFSVLSIYSILPSAVVGLFFYIALLITLGSFNKSQHTIYLHRKGSVFLSVMSIISAIFFIVMIFNIQIQSSLLQNMTEAAGIYLRQFGYGEFYMPDPTSNIFTVISYAVQAVTSVLFAVLGLSYNSYIKKLSTSISSDNSKTYSNTGPEVTAKNKSVEYAPMNMWNEASNADDSKKASQQTKPVAFDPQPVNFEPEPVHFGNTFAANEHEGAQPLPLAHTKRCTACGREWSAEFIFCGGCGTKLK